MKKITVIDFFVKFFRRGDKPSQYIVKDPRTNEVILTTSEEEKAYRVALGKVRMDLVMLDKGEHWKSLASFDRDAICTGFKEMYYRMKRFDEIELPLVCKKNET
jgi:hypothetical protein